jgi:replicative DNA helicase
MAQTNQVDKIPPQSLNAEKSLIGAVLLDKETMLRVGDIITTEDFYKDGHSRIYDVMTELYEKNEPIDILTVSNRLEEKGVLEKCGGQSYLAELADAVPTSAHAAHYAHLIHKKATRRRLLYATQEITKLGYNEEEEIDQLLDHAQQHLYGVSKNYMKQNFTPIKGVLSEAFDRIDELHKNKGKMRGIPTGFKDLDNLLAGLQKSDLVILAARPSVGKTSLALDIIRHAGARQKIPTGLFSLEMSKEQLVDRMLCAEANVDLWRMRTGRLSERPEDDDFPRIGHAMGVLSESPIFIDDTASLNITQIRTKARRLQMEHGLGLIVVDYLQLMESNAHSENRVQAVAEITRGLKAIARELNIPVLALSQLSRVVEQSKPSIPKLSHLRESGSIEQDADVVLFIYRKSADRNYRPEEVSPDEKYISEIHIAKHRNGPTGIVKTFFDEQRASFKNLDKQQSYNPPSGGQMANQTTNQPPAGLKPKSYFEKKNEQKNTNPATPPV